MSEEERQNLKHIAAMYGFSEAETVRVVVRWFKDNRPPIYQAAIVPNHKPS